jgi:hypothetical protein
MLPPRAPQNTQTLNNRNIAIFKLCEALTSEWVEKSEASDKDCTTI